MRQTAPEPPVSEGARFGEEQVIRVAAREDRADLRARTHLLPRLPRGACRPF
jgi:hypothetical protein